MTALNKYAALRVPERKRHDWSQSVMRDCDFCSQLSLTVKHENGGCICASCCDAEYTSELKCALEAEIDRADSAEKRNAELTEALRNSVIGYKSCLRMGHERIIDLGGDCDAPEVMIAGNPDIQQAEKLLAAGIGVKGE